MFTPIKSSRKTAICYYCAAELPVGSKMFRQSFLDNLNWKSVAVCVSCAHKKGVEA